MDYYPLGGMKDLQYSCDTIEVAIDYIKLCDETYIHHILDTLNREFIYNE